MKYSEKTKNVSYLIAISKFKATTTSYFHEKKLILHFKILLYYLLKQSFFNNKSH